MYLTIKQQLKHLTKDEYRALRELSHVAKNLTNEAIYNIRQYYFTNHKYLNYYQNYETLKLSPNYKLLNSNMAQQILKTVDESFKSFFKLIKMSKNGEYDYKKCKLPNYLPKDGFATLIIGFVRINQNKLIIPYSNTYKKAHNPIEVRIPPTLRDKKIKEIRIIPMYDARFFEIQYTYEETESKKKLSNKKALAVDFGVNNLATCVTNKGQSFIIDGKRLKSINQYYNKENSKLQSIKDKQNIKKITNMQARLTKNRNNRVNDYMSKAARLIINYCLDNDIGILIVGYNKNFKNESNIGTVNNQNLIAIPHSKLFQKLKYLSQFFGIRFIEQEESYTSKASFFDKDRIPVYKENNKKEYAFSGKRIHRGLYKTGSGYLLNADVNGALNIMRKSKVVSTCTLYRRGVVDTPIRIRVF